MKKVLIFLFMLSTLAAMAQRNFRIGFSLYPNISSTLYVADNSYQNQVDIWKEVEQPKFSFGGNAFVEFKLAKRKTLTIGLGYLNYGERTKKYSFGDSSFPEELDPFYGFVRPQNEVSGSYEWRNIYTTHSIEVPLSYRYYFNSRFYTAVGMSVLTQIAHKRTHWEKFEGQSAACETTDDNRAELRPLNMAVNASLGYTFFQGKKVNWFVAARIQHVLFGVMQDVDINRKYISGGIVTGILF
jgi:hypothetical protein